jgi:hypothetical protein
MDFVNFMSIKQKNKRPASSRVKQNAQPQEPKTSSSSSSWSPILWDEYLTQVKRWRMNVSIRFYHILVYLSWIRVLLWPSLFLSGSITSFSQDLPHYVCRILFWYIHFGGLKHPEVLQRSRYPRLLVKLAKAFRVPRNGLPKRGGRMLKDGISVDSLWFFPFSML